MSFGFVMGLGSLASMLLGFEMVPGLILDFRTPLLAVAGFFGGWPAAVISAAFATLYRVWIGGVGTGVGTLTILVAASLGILGYYLRGKDGAEYRKLLILAAAVAAVRFASFHLLPSPLLAEILERAAAPIVALTFAGTFLLGVVLLKEEKRRDLMHKNFMYRALVESLPDPLNVKDLNGRFLLANSATAKLMQASSPANLIGKTDFDFYPDDVAGRFRADEEAFAAAGVTQTIDQPVTFSDGTSGWLSTLKAPFHDADGRLIGIITHNRDITERKTLQLQLDTTRQQLDDALTSMTDALVLYDADGRLVFANARYQELFPKTAELHVPGTRLEDIIRGAALRGETVVPPGTDLQAWGKLRAAQRLAPGETFIELTDGRCLESRSRAVANGGTLIVFSDVTMRRNQERDLQRKAMHDPLTDLPNRTMFMAHLSRIYAEAAAGGHELAVMLLDLDRFKDVNDRFGHAAGDQLLVEVAARLKSAMRQSDLVARLGGDEFAVIAYGPDMERAAAGLATRILRTLTKPVSIDNVDLLPGCSIGYTIYPANPGSPQSLLADADTALYEAKALGRGRAKLYRPQPAAVSRAG